MVCLAACVAADLWRHGHGGVPPLPVVNQVRDLGHDFIQGHS